jgi:hypothetical protein
LNSQCKQLCKQLPSRFKPSNCLQSQCKQLPRARARKRNFSANNSFIGSFEPSANNWVPVQTIGSSRAIFNCLHSSHVLTCARAVCKQTVPLPTCTGRSETLPSEQKGSVLELPPTKKQCFTNKQLLFEKSRTIKEIQHEIQTKDRKHQRPAGRRRVLGR